MRTVQTSLLAGAAMIVFAGVAQAQSPGTHVITIHLPGGGIEQIRYSGDVPPEIFLGPNAALADSPLLFSAFGPDSPFAGSTGFPKKWTSVRRACWSRPRR